MHDDSDPPDDSPTQPPRMSPELRQRLALALGTTDARVLAAAASCCVGRFPSAHAFIAREISEHLPDFLQWIVPCLDPERTRSGYEGTETLVWTITLGPSDALVFQSLRAACGTKFSIADEDGRRITTYAGDV